MWRGMSSGGYDGFGAIAGGGLGWRSRGQFWIAIDSFSGWPEALTEIAQIAIAQNAADRATDDRVA